jgi:Quercetinase C-terminal cupin domain
MEGDELKEGDGVALSNEPALAITAVTDAEVMLFDLA